ncbi:MAG: prepilin-type N-terminal cleavage/methylation domain-containing protein [Candidatus Shapirobacteria bacterium]
MIYDLRIGQGKKSGFTFIELLISISIIMLLVGGVMASFNSFAVKNKLDNAKEEVMSNLRLARSYAVSMQGAEGTTGSNLKYVKVEMNTNGVMTVMMDSDEEYFSRDLTPAEMTVAMTPTSLLFGAYEGKAGSLLGSDIEFFDISGVGETAAIKLTDTIFGTDSRTIIVNAAGVINEQK